MKIGLFPIDLPVEYAPIRPPQDPVQDQPDLQGLAYAKNQFPVNIRPVEAQNCDENKGDIPHPLQVIPDPENITEQKKGETHVHGDQIVEIEGADDIEESAHQQKKQNKE